MRQPHQTSDILTHVKMIFFCIFDNVAKKKAKKIVLFENNVRSKAYHSTVFSGTGRSTVEASKVVSLDFRLSLPGRHNQSGGLTVKLYPPGRCQHWLDKC